jgi:hypothetical protein
VTELTDAQERGYSGLTPSDDGDWLTIAGVSRPAPTNPPVLTALEPNTAVIGSPPLQMVCRGTAITRQTAIYFGAAAVAPERTDAIDDTACATLINMPLWDAPTTVDVHLISELGESNALPFTFTAA